MYLLVLRDLLRRSGRLFRLHLGYQGKRRQTGSRPSYRRRSHTHPSDCLGDWTLGLGGRSLLGMETLGITAWGRDLRGLGKWNFDPCTVCWFYALWFNSSTFLGVLSFIELSQWFLWMMMEGWRRKKMNSWLNNVWSHRQMDGENGWTDAWVGNFWMDGWYVYKFWMDGQMDG